MAGRGGGGGGGVPIADAAVWDGALQRQRGRCRQLVLELVVMATDTTLLAAGSRVGKGDMARWQHREQPRWTRQVVQLVQAGKRGNRTADGQAG